MSAVKSRATCVAGTPGIPQAGAEMDSPEPGDCERREAVSRREAVRPIQPRPCRLVHGDLVGVDLPAAEIADQEVAAELAETCVL